MGNEIWVTAWSYAQRRTSFTRWENQNSFEIEIPNNISGYGIKLKFSNWYGTRIVGIRKTDISLQGYRHPIFVNGKQEFYLTPAEDIYSEPVFLDIVPGETVKINVTFTDELRPESGNTFQDGIAMILQSVLIAVNDKVDIIAFFGDSIIHRQKWTKPLIRKWYEEYPGKLAAFEVSVDGSRLLNDSPIREDETLGFRAVKRFLHDILENPGINYVVFSLGLNDLSMEQEGENALTLETYKQEVKKIVDIAHGRKIKMIGLTITPRLIDGFYTNERNSLRREINRWILNEAPFDMAVDVAAVVSNESDTALKTEYQDIDGIHINEKAGNVIAGILEKAGILEVDLCECGGMCKTDCKSAI